MKVFLVNDTDGEGDAFYAASTRKKAWNWIKERQHEDWHQHCLRKDWGPAKSEGFKQTYLDRKNLHPYDIQEIEVDEEY